MDRLDSIAGNLECERGMMAVAVFQVAILGKRRDLLDLRRSSTFACRSCVPTAAASTNSSLQPWPHPNPTPAGPYRRCAPVFVHSKIGLTRVYLYQPCPLLRTNRDHHVPPASAAAHGQLASTYIHDWPSQTVEAPRHRRPSTGPPQSSRCVSPSQGHRRAGKRQ